MQKKSSYLNRDGNIKPVYKQEKHFDQTGNFCVLSIWKGTRNDFFLNQLIFFSIKCRGKIQWNDDGSVPV